MRVIESADVVRLLTMDDCIAAVERAFVDHGETGVLSAHADRGAFHIKTAVVAGRFGAKANSNFPGNQPAIRGVMLLFDAMSGEPLAVMDSIELTALRTAAATAVAAKYLAPRNARTAMIVGCGKQGRMHLDAIRRVLSLDRMFAMDADPARLAAFCADTPAIDGSGEPPQSIDVWVTCTPSRKPFLFREHVRPGAFVAAVGADNSSKNEIAAELMAASRVICDVAAQCVEMGDLHHAIAAGAVAAGELAEVISGRIPARRNDDEVVIFDSTGAGFEDTAAASIVYDRSRR